MQDLVLSFLSSICRFQRNLDVDFATACLESALRRHGDLIARPPTTNTEGIVQEADFGVVIADDMVVKKTTETQPYRTPFQLVEQVLEAKRCAQTSLFGQITRSIALIDFVRNATCALQM